MSQVVGLTFNDRLKAVVSGIPCSTSRWPYFQTDTDSQVLFTSPWPYFHDNQLVEVWNKLSSQDPCWTWVVGLKTRTRWSCCLRIRCTTITCRFKQLIELPFDAVWRGTDTVWRLFDDVWQCLPRNMSQSCSVTPFLLGIESFVGSWWTNLRLDAIWLSVTWST